MSFYDDLHNLYHGETTSVVGPVEEEEEVVEVEKEAEKTEYEATDQSVIQAMKKAAKEQEYFQRLERENRERNLATAVNTAVYGAGILWFWNLINGKT